MTRSIDGRSTAEFAGLLGGVALAATTVGVIFGLIQGRWGTWTALTVSGLMFGLHLGWNITTVAIVGTIGSGGDARAALVEAVTHGPTWLTGGDFGPEGSLVAVAACTVATVYLLASARRSGRNVGRRHR